MCKERYKGTTFLGGKRGFLCVGGEASCLMKIDSRTGLQRMKGAGNVSRSGDRRLRTAT